MIKQKFLSAGLMVLIGIGTTVGATEYQLGSLARMGPGYYPLALGVILTLLGLLIAFTPDSPDEVVADHGRRHFMETVRSHVRPWVACIGGMLAFIVLGKWGGLVPATLVLIFVAAQGDPKNSLKASLLLAIGVTVFAVAVFRYGMQMQFPLFSWG